MNIFDPLITGSLSVSGSGEISGDLTVLGTINATISGTTSNAISASEAPKYTLTSSFEEFTSSIVSKTGSYATTGSNLFKGTQTHSGSILPSVDNTYDLGSVEYQWRDVYISSGSLYIDGTKVLSSTAQELTITTDNGQSLKILEGTTDSIVLQVADGDIELKSSADGDILLDPTNGKIMLKGPVEIFNGNKIQSSVNGTPVVFANDIVVSGSIELTGTIDGIDLSSLSSSLNTRIGSIESTTLLLNEFTSSANGRLNNLESETSSLSSSIGSVSSSITNTTNNLSSSIGVFSSSFTSTITNLSSSMITLSSSFTDTDISHNNRLNTIESRYATTGSNVFIGNQTITGSLYVSQNLIVQGESSLENVTASAVSIGTNTVILNADTPSVRYAGIAVYDSGSTNVTASLLYDSLTNQWKFKHLDTGTNDASVLLYGPLGNDIDNTPTLTSNFLTKVEDNGHGHHLTTSSVFDNGAKISLKNNTEVTGSLIVTGTLVSQGTTLISGSSQVSFSTISDKPSGIISGSSQVVSSLPNGTVSGSSQVSFTTISDKPTLISGSSQVSFTTISDKPTLVSGSSQITFSSISSIPGGLVSGSSQIDLTSTTNYSSGIKTRLNAEGVVSGSSQITLTSTQVTNGLGFTPATDTHTHNLSRYSLRAPDNVDSLSSTNFRTQVFGSSSSGYSLSAARWNSVPTGLSGMNMYGTLFAWAGSDTHGFIATDYSTANIQVGGGSGDSITWKATLIHSGNIASQSVSYSTTAGALTSMNISQFTNNSNYITGISFANVSSKPTTISGYGITDALYQGSTTIDVNAFNSTGLYRGSTGGWSNRPTVVHNGGALLQIDTHPGNYHQQLFFDSGGNRLYMRSADAGSWGGWVTMWHTGNLTNLNQLTNGPGYITSSGSISGNAGSVTNGVYTTGNQTIGGIKTFSTRINLHQSGAGGGENIFNGIEGPTTANGRGQFVISSAYSDLVIASSQTNSNHGSTLSFTTYNPSNSADYRKFVVNQGNWGSRAGFLDFGFANASRPNPHEYINATDDVMSLDGYNKRVGVNEMNPSYNLHVNGTGFFSSNVLISGTLTENSSLRYKKEIKTIENGLDKVLRMRGVTYLKKENDIKEVGVIAEEIGEILPDLVKYNTEGQIDSVSYGRITAVLIEAIKELKQEINELKNNG